MPPRLTASTSIAFEDYVTSINEDFAGFQKYQPLSRMDAAQRRAFIDRVLSGITRGDDVTEQYHVHMQDAGPMFTPTTYIDIDSVIALSSSWLWQDQFDINVWPPPVGVYGNLHLQVTFVDAYGSEEERDPGQDCALWFGRCGPSGRHSIYLVLPHLELARDSEMGKLQQEEIRQAIYETARNTLATLDAPAANAWPRSWEAEKLRATLHHRNNPTRSTRTISATIAEDFGERFMRALEAAHPWARNLYTIVQVRNAKDSTRQERVDFDAAETLQSLLWPIAIDPGMHLFVDVAIEIHGEPDEAVFPKRQSLPALMAHLLNCELADYEAMSATSLDVWAGVAALCGGRFRFASPIGPYAVYYAQVYFTDKSQYYNASSKFLAPHLQALDSARMMSGEECPPFIAHTHNALRQSSGGDGSAPTSIATRIEFRTKNEDVEALVRHLTSFRLADLTMDFYVLPAACAWDWKVFRVDACQLALREVADAARATRLQIESLTAAAAVVYVFNAIWRSPGDRSEDRLLTEAVWGHTRRTDARAAALAFFTTARKVPLMDRGVMFVPAIAFPCTLSNIVRFEYERARLEAPQICRIFNADLSRLQSLLGTPAQKAAPRVRRNLKAPLALPARGLADGPTALTPAPQPYDLRLDLPPEARTAHDLQALNADTLAARIVAEVAVRINPPDSGHVTAYWQLAQNAHMRNLIGPRTFADSNILTYFPLAHVCADQKKYLEVVDKLFPPTRAIRAFASKPYWKKFGSFQQLMSYAEDSHEEDWQRTVKAGRDMMLNQFRWYPAVEVDRTCRYSKKQGDVSYGVIQQVKGVRLVWNIAKFNLPSTEVGSHVTADPAALRELQQRRQEEHRLEHEAWENGGADYQATYAEPAIDLGSLTLVAHTLEPQVGRARANGFPTIPSTREIAVPSLDIDVEEAARIAALRQEEEESESE